jgi:N-formylglutamate deformylase
LISKDLYTRFALNESDQLREEDPYTWIWTGITENSIVAHHSRFEFDLNRPPEKAVYMLPSDAWGLEMWKTKPSASMIAKSLQRYSEIYQNFHVAISELVEKFGGLVVFDLHSYNHRRNGPDAPPEDTAQNPEINVGTGTMDRIYWGSLVDRFLLDLRSYDFLDRHLDVRENVKFKGGYFSKWIHEHFNGSVCCLSIEVKKFFMDEWTGIPDHSMIHVIGKALKSTVPGVLEELAKRKQNP